MTETASRVSALEARAAQTRARLAHTLDELDERKSRLLQAVKTVSTPPTSIIVGAVVGVAAAAFIVQRLRARRRRSSLRGLLEAHARPQQGLLARGLQSAGLSLLELLARRLGARGVDHLLGRGDGLPFVPQPLTAASCTSAASI